MDSGGGMRWVVGKTVIVVVRGVVGYEDGEVGIVVDVEYGGGVVEWVREDVVLVRIPDGVLPNTTIVTYGRR